MLLLVMISGFLLAGCQHEPDDQDNPHDVQVVKSQLTYLEGTDDAFTVHTFETDVPGPTFFIIAGIHGDERAGWMAAQSLLSHDFKRGTVHILPVANHLSILADPPRRNAPGRNDLNRAFPGDPDGNLNQQLAYALIQVMAAKEPDIVLDLHESLQSYVDGRIGDSIILHHSQYSLYALEVLERFNALPLQEGRIPFTNLNAPPQGSINRVFTDIYSIPVFTIETNRDVVIGTGIEQVPLSLRIEQQLAMIHIFLETFDKF